MKSPSKSSKASGKENQAGSGGKQTSGGNVTGGGMKGNVFGFGGTSFGLPSGGSSGLQTKGKTGAFVVNPGWKTKDNSSGGSVINSSGTTTSTSSKSSSSTSSSTTTSDNSDVRNQVRNFWANKYSTSSNSSSTSSKHAKESKIIVPNESQERKESCPICNQLIKISVINAHVDQCLSAQDANLAGPSSNVKSTTGSKAVASQNPFIDDDENDDNDDIREVATNSNTAKKEETYPCPVCQKQIYAGEMNVHLDNCIT